ncbi:MAG: hypothetical protein A3J83_07365 [Elusimicrobia bacterium RIFOXYA2_FULL_40_6]|nr:MAG: hypothetical protein A3J83_07365 [Elusimicrobia bacterium RIFOXYA2_FULL_40_6]
MGIDYKKDSEILKSLGHPLRLQIVVGLLENDGCNVNKMVDQLGLPQSTVSQNLAILRHNGVIVCRREGVQNCYRIADKRIVKIIRALNP